MDTERRKLLRTLYLPPYEPAVQDVLEAAEELRRRHGATFDQIKLAIDDYVYEREVRLQVYTPETDEEYQARLEQFEAPKKKLGLDKREEL